MAAMSRDTIPTPVTDLGAFARQPMPDAYTTIEGVGGAVLRIETALGRKPGVYGVDDEGAGLLASHARHKAETRKLAQTIGRMPGSEGLDDEGDGIARFVFEQRVLAKQGTRVNKGSLVLATVAFIGAATALIQAYTSARYSAGPLERPAAAAESPKR